MKLFGSRGKRTSEKKQTRSSNDLRRGDRAGAVRDRVNNKKENREAVRKTRKQGQINKKTGRTKALVAFILIIIILAAGFGVWFYFRDRDTAAPLTYTLLPVVILEGRSVSPAEFLSPADLQTGVTAEFINPDFTPHVGRQGLPVRLSNGEETRDDTAYLYVLVPIESVRAELGVLTQDLRPEEFITNIGIIPDNVSYDLRFTVKPMPLHEYPAGEFILFLSFNDVEFEVILYVEDTTAPVVNTIEVSVPKGDEAAPDDFISSISDTSPIASVDFVTIPDFFTVGTQIIEIAVEDIFGNRTIGTTMLTVLANDIPPEITGTRDIDAMLGSRIMYLQGVSAYDAFGRPLEITIDSSDVNQNQRGIYTVIYRAEDIYGLISEVEISVHILNIDTDWVDERIDAIFADIFTDEMTQVEQARAIFTWIKGNITFISMAAAPRSSYEGAFRALQDRRGGCTIFSSLSDVMLHRADIPTLRIERVPEAPSRHRWNLINPDGLGWYHFDAFPILLGGPRDELYMFTASHAAEFTRLMEAVDSVRMYYVYDPSLYPEIVYE